MSDYTAARHNMVESQIRPNEVTDARLLRALLEVPREIFVPVSQRGLAYMEEEITIVPPRPDAPGRALIAPMPMARLMQLAEVNPGDLVLDVGCTTGYTSAILAHLAESVVALEEDETLAERASANLMEQGVDNAAAVLGPLREGYAAEGPYDVIVLNGCVPDVPDALLKQLKQGGRLVAIIAENDFGTATLFLNSGGRISSRPVFDAGGPILPGFRKAAEFVF